ncbi:MAG: hypothetical protein RXR08_13160 [Sulfolobaceae archaeon]
MKMRIPITGNNKADNSYETPFDVAKRSVSVIGYRGAGKTTFMGLFTIHIDYLASIDNRITYILKPGVYDFPLPEWDEILEKIRNGEPLPPTDVTKKPYVGRLVVTYPKLLGSGEVNIPIVDLAGELYQPIMDFIFNSKSKDFDYKKWNEDLIRRLESLGITKDDLRNIYGFIFNAKAYLIIINLEHALSAISKNNASNDNADTKSLLGRYFTVVTNLVNHRKEQKDLPHVGIVLTHYDKVREYIEGTLGFNVWGNYNDRIRLMNYMRSEILKLLRNLSEDVPIFITYYEKPSVPIDPDTGLRLPDYPKKEYNEIFNWIKEVLK